MKQSKPHSVTAFNKKFTVLTHTDTISEHPERLETFGGDLIQLDEYKREQIWSLLKQDDSQVLKAGKFVIGLVGYVVTKEAWSIRGEEYSAPKSLTI